MQIRSGYEIAVVGLGGRFPGAETISQFWENLCLGKDNISPSNSTFGADESEAHWVETPQFLKDAYHFDASFFGMSPREAELTDARSRLVQGQVSLVFLLYRPEVMYCSNDSHHTMAEL